MSTPMTLTKIAAMKREAKRLAKTSGVTHGQALEHLARQAGFSSWFEANESLKHAKIQQGKALLDIPIDPKLRRGFDNTPHEDRSDAEIAKWWMRPFAVTRPDGTFDVRCLCSGAWDRSVFWGLAADLDQVQAIASLKLAEWQSFMNTPIVLIAGADEFQMTIEALRPGFPRPVLATLDSQAAAKAWADDWKTLAATQPQKSAAKIAAARAMLLSWSDDLPHAPDES